MNGYAARRWPVFRPLLKRASFAASALALVCATLASPAVADSSAERVEARERFDRGLRLVNQGDNEGAIAEFQRAYELSPHPVVLYNLGLVFAATSHPVQAVETFDRLLSAPGDLPPEQLARVRDERARQAARIGEIEVTVNVAGASVELDGVEVGTTPLAAPLRVAGGAHIVGAVARGHAPQRRRVSVAGQARAQVQLELVPIEGKLAQLEVLSNVPNAEVLVDGEPVGTTPLHSSLALSPGTRQVELRRPGYVSAQQTVTLGPASSGRITLDLEPDPRALTSEGGTLALAISEPDAVVFVDGEPVGAYAGPLRLAHGEHRVRVERAEFLPFERTVNVPRGGQSEIVIELEPTAEKRASYRAKTVTQRTWGYVAVGAGALVTAGSLGFVLWNMSEESDAEERFDAEADKQRPGGSCDREAGNQTKTCIQALQLALEDLDSVRAREKYGWIGAGVGLAVAGVGTVLLLTNDDPDRYEPRPESDVFGRLELTPLGWFGPGSAGAAVAGRF